jgi:F0F1-type ATP synthase membrane subunit b/b'
MNYMPKFGLRLLAATVFSLATSALVFSAEGEPSSQGMLQGDFKWVHFVIVAALFIWVFGKLLPPWFKSNADVIAAAINKAKAAKAEAEAKLQEATAKLARLEQEVAQFRASAERDAAAEVERLKAAMQTDAQKIAAAARAEIDAAERAARAELKALAAKLAVEGAEQRVSQRMTPAIQESMVSRFVHSLQERLN